MSVKMAGWLIDGAAGSPAHTGHQDLTLSGRVCCSSPQSSRQSLQSIIPEKTIGTATAASFAQEVPCKFIHARTPLYRTEKIGDSATSLNATGNQSTSDTEFAEDFRQPCIQS